MAPDMPAAALHRGTTAGQRRVVATLETLPEAARDLEAPSVIVVGRVCRLSDPFAWAERRPPLRQAVFGDPPPAGGPGL